MTVQTIENDLLIHETPLESIQLDGTSVTVCLDDADGKRKRLLFRPYQAFRSTSEDCADFSFLDGLHNGFPWKRYERPVYEVIDSPWIRDLRQSLAVPNDDFLEKSHHYVIHLGKNVVEIISWNVEIADANEMN